MTTRAVCVNVLKQRLSRGAQQASGCSAGVVQEVVRDGSWAGRTAVVLHLWRTAGPASRALCTRFQDARTLHSEAFRLRTLTSKHVD